MISTGRGKPVDSVVPTLQAIVVLCILILALMITQIVLSASHYSGILKEFDDIL